MEDTLIFNSAAFSALDEWVGGGQDTATRAAEQDDHQQHQQHQHHAQHGRWKRAGVGAVTANPKEATAQLEATGSLQKLVMGHRSKNKREREAAEEEVAAVAAGAEAEEEDNDEAQDDSKARVFATASSTVLPLANTGSVPDGEVPKKKNKKRKKKKAQAGPRQEQEREQEPKTEDADKTGKAAALAKKGETPVPGHHRETQQPQQSTHQALHHQKQASTSHPNERSHCGGGRDGTAQKQGQQRLRKRTKTRSKQKNIRRDTRPVDQRPEHLRPGHAAFDGRGMTDETRKRLGFKEEGGKYAEM